MIEKISVAICTYNGEQFLKEQIDSILNQSISVDEIVICDDGSNDSTILILEEYSLKNPNLFRIHRNYINLGSIKNFEKAITLCVGEIIFLSDQDDVWSHNKVEIMINYFNEHKKINVIATNGFCINENSEIQEKYSVWDVPEFLREKNIDFNYNQLISNVSNIATGASMAFRKNILTEIIPFPKVQGFHHDEWIAIISSSNDSFSLLNEKYFYYRIHQNQQVGGVFINKTEKEKTVITEVFDINNYNIRFESYKKRLKKLKYAYERNFEILNSTKKHTELFQNKLIEIEELFYLTSKKMKDNFPFMTTIINMSDKILNKRQFQKKL